VVNDIINTYTSNPYGQKSVHLANDVYNQTVKPVLPYLDGPLSYVKPYAAKADEMGDASLSKVDETFPIVKEDSEKVKSTIFDYAFYPLRFAGESKDYVFKTYNDEYQKTGGQGIITTAKAIVSTELKIASDVLHAFGDWLGPKKEQAKDYYQQAQEKAGEFRNEAEKKYGEVKGQAQDKSGEAKGQAQAKYSEAKGQAQDKYGEAKGQAEQTKEQTKKEANAKMNG